MDPPRGKLIKQYYKPGRASPAGIEHSLFSFPAFFQSLRQRFFSVLIEQKICIIYPRLLIDGDRENDVAPLPGIEDSVSAQFQRPDRLSVSDPPQGTDGAPYRGRGCASPVPGVLSFRGDSFRVNSLQVDFPVQQIPGGRAVDHDHYKR